MQAFTANAILGTPTGPPPPVKGGPSGIVVAPAPPSVTLDNKRPSGRKKKDWKGAPPKERVAMCELCGGVYPYPVTFHMRQAHAGCGSHAGGKGYNSGGNFCVGWAGNCGDGGVGGSSWYLVCDSCRERYLRARRPPARPKPPTARRRPAPPSPGPAPAPPPLLSPSGNPAAGVEWHLVMKENALFLLELSSGQGSGGNKSAATTPAERPWLPSPGFQCLSALGAHPSALDALDFPQDFRDSAASTPSRPQSEVLEESDIVLRGTFHRSMSMGTSGGAWSVASEVEIDVQPPTMTRKRNNSTCDLPQECGSVLLWRPSGGLQRLVGDESDLLCRPALAFLLQHHNLHALRLAMRQALRKATCRIFAMQALDWLLHTVTQPACLHDLFWWLVVGLTPPHQPQPDSVPLPADPSSQLPDQPPPPAPHFERRDEHEMMWVCEHPLSDMGIAGEAVHPLPAVFHGLLQSIADLMLLLPPGSALQQMAVRCWGINFTQQDHMFLHRSQVFSHISKILSRSEEEQEEMNMMDSHLSGYSQQGSDYVEALADLTPGVDIRASSRQAMVGSLTDGTTETFWESGDEDRNKTKYLTITCPAGAFPTMVYVHIDNCRDLANKVSCVTFQSGPNAEELYKVRCVEVESRATGWISCLIIDRRDNVIRLEVKGGDNSLRLRQIRVLGQVEGESLKVSRQHTTAAIQHRNTESETLKVFRLVTSQVFGKLLKGGEDGEKITPEEAEMGESNDLKEHVVGILFSRSKLTHLQKQVCWHIVGAIRKEATIAREEWELRLCSPSSAGSSPNSSPLSDTPTDTYCFEMLSMVLALSGSGVGRSHLSHQHGLLVDVLGLLHTGSARVQRQVTALLRRMLPEVSPDVLAQILGVKHLPPADFSIAAVTSTKIRDNISDQIGILDVFLSCIAKALTVQVKAKGKESKGVASVSLATCIHPRDDLGSRWWLRGTTSRKLAEDMISLIKDMSAGKVGEAWSVTSKGAVAENIIALTMVSEERRGSAECLKSPSLWLALASLCVLDADHVERLSSARWRHSADGNPPPPTPTCSNHDDGETTAIIQCNVCGNLCTECDRYLHLHRRTRMHHRQVCKEEEEAIRVDVHEGCGRTKLFWALLLADRRTLKALVEFREPGAASTRPGLPRPPTGVCRFCGAASSSGLLSIGNICPDYECQEHGRNACSKVLTCGHLCGGIAEESDCLPCLHGCSQNPTLKQDSDDMCMICFVDALSLAPAIQLKCGHVFHLHCCKKVLTKRWAGPRITFSFSQCPICKSPMEHLVLGKLLDPILDLYEDVKRKAVMRLEYEGLDQGREDPAAYAMQRYAYYVCFKCNKAYYGGEARCEVEAGGVSEFDPSELVCGACSDVSRAQMCPKHGADFLEYKCRYCCSVAVFFCFGTTHFCNPCHDDFQRVTNIPKNELPSCPAGPKAKQLEGEECPLHVKHPQTGEEFALGCGVCRNAHTF